MTLPRSSKPRSCCRHKAGVNMTMPTRCSTTLPSVWRPVPGRGSPESGGLGLASQPTLSRFIAPMVEPTNLKVLREAVQELSGSGIRPELTGKKIACVTLDVDSAPI